MEIPIKVLEIDQMGYHLIIELKINNLKANGIIDTGASRTVIDLNRLDHYEESPNTKAYEKSCIGVGAGQIKSFVTTLKTVALGEISLQNFDIVAIDLSNINQNYALFDLPRIDVVIGSDLLLKLNAIIDYGAKTLLLKASD